MAACIYRMISLRVSMPKQTLLSRSLQETMKSSQSEWQQKCVILSVSLFYCEWCFSFADSTCWTSRLIARKIVRNMSVSMMVLQSMDPECSGPPGNWSNLSSGSSEPDVETIHGETSPFASCLQQSSRFTISHLYWFTLMFDNFQVCQIKFDIHSTPFIKMT